MASIIKLDPEDVTVLVAGEAALHGGLTVDVKNYMRQHVSDWSDPREGFTWTVDVPSAGDYVMTAVMLGNGNIAIEADAGLGQLLTGGGSAAAGDTSLFDGQGDTGKASVGWERKNIGHLHLKSGLNTIRLYAKEKSILPMQFYSLELVKSAVKRKMDEEAQVMRSDTSWLADAAYGVMFQWTNRSEPKMGHKKPWQQSVDDFDLKAFTEMILETGAAYVIWTSSWGPQYLPAPIKAVESVLPGRASRRDLMGEMMEALLKHGIKTILYYHSGYDCYHSIDKEWFEAIGGYKADKTEFFINLCSIINEIGERYGRNLAGWFFDGSQRYYDTHYDGTPSVGPNHAPWKRLATLAKKGNTKRIISFNSWVRPRLTDFQDFYAGEGYNRDRFPPIGGNGIYPDGPQEGLQAHSCFTLERCWGHLEKGTISEPRFTVEELSEMIQDAASRKASLSINMEMYEDGSVSPASLDVLKQVRKKIRRI